MSYLERTPAEWFAAAARCYEEGHQACAWCGISHQVFRTARDGQVDYHCSHCDFHVVHDADLDRYALVPGDTRTRKPARLTMLDR
jgi:hypothetical protein